LGKEATQARDGAVLYVGHFGLALQAYLT
jgi:hypothetical protein